MHARIIYALRGIHFVSQLAKSNNVPWGVITLTVPHLWEETISRATTSLLYCVSGELEKCGTLSYVLWRALPQPRLRVCTVACLSLWPEDANTRESIATPLVHSQQLLRSATVMQRTWICSLKMKTYLKSLYLHLYVVLCIISCLAYI